MNPDNVKVYFGGIECVPTYASVPERQPRNIWLSEPDMGLVEVFVGQARNTDTGYWHRLVFRVMADSEAHKYLLSLDPTDTTSFTVRTDEASPL